MLKTSTARPQVRVEPKKAVVEEIGARPPQDREPSLGQPATIRFVYRASDVAPSQETSIWLG